MAAAAAPGGNSVGLFGVRGFGIWERFSGSGKQDPAPATPEDLAGEEERRLPSVPLPFTPQPVAVAVAAVFAANPALSCRVVARCRPPENGDGHGAVVPTASLEAGASPVRIRFATAPSAGSFCCDAFLGPGAGSDAVLGEVAHIARHAAEGRQCAIICHGAAGSGKTYTLAGPLDSSGVPLDSASKGGVVQQLARQLFECINERSLNGDVIVVDATFLEVRASGRGTEELRDLLVDDGPDLEVLPDPRSDEAYVVDGLHSTPVRGPEQLNELLAAGLRRAAARRAAAAATGRLVACAHSVLTVRIEAMMMEEGTLEPIVREGKLLFVDLAGSENIDQTYSTEGCLAMLQGPRLTVNTRAYCEEPGSAVTMLLRGCLAEAQVVLIANIHSSADRAAESAQTLAVAQQFVISDPEAAEVVIQEASAGAAVEAPHKLLDEPLGETRCVCGNAFMPDANFCRKCGARREAASPAEEVPTSVQQMRDRNQEVMSLFRQKNKEAAEIKKQETELIKKGIAEMSQRLESKGSIEQVLANSDSVQTRKIDELRGQMEQSIKVGMQSMQAEALGDLHLFKQSVAVQLTTLDAQQSQKAKEAEAGRVEQASAEHRAAAQARRAAEEEAAKLRERLASAEVRAQLLQEDQEDLMRDRGNFAGEKSTLQQQADQQRQKQAQVERETHKMEAEIEVQAAELRRMKDMRAKDGQGLTEARERWQSQEANLQGSLAQLQQEVSDVRRSTEVQALRSETEMGEATSELRRQIQRLEEASAKSTRQLEQVKEQQAKLEVELRVTQQREQQMQEEFRRQGRPVLMQYKQELADILKHEEELKAMLQELTESLLEAEDGAG